MEKMSLTTSSGKALLLRASFSSSWKNTYSRSWVTGPVAEKDLHPQHSPGGDKHSPRGFGVPPQLAECFHLLNLPSISQKPWEEREAGKIVFQPLHRCANQGLKTQGLGQRLAADECQKWAYLMSVKSWTSPGSRSHC